MRDDSLPGGGVPALRLLLKPGRARHSAARKPESLDRKAGEDTGRRSAVTGVQRRLQSGLHDSVQTAG